MQKIESITLRQLLPHVFRGSEHEAPVKFSNVWLADIEFQRGNFYLIEAESGAGKSSLCSYIYGLRHDYNGTILFNGHDTAAYDIDRWCALRRRHLAYLPQEMHLFPELTAFENVELKNKLTGYKSESQIRKMFERLGVSDRADRLAAKLSVGQQQRVAVIRALCQPFDFLLIDEPVSHLDDKSNAAVAALVNEEARAQGAAVIATSVGNHIQLPDMQSFRL